MSTAATRTPITIDTTGTLGSVTNNPNGTFTYNPNGAFESLALGETAQDTFTYIVHDNHSGNSVVKTVTVTIAGANDAPVVADVSANSGEDGGVLVNADSAMLTHPTRTLSPSTRLPRLVRWSTTTTAPSAMTPMAPLKSLAAGETAEDTFTYTVTDGNGMGSNATATITITGANDAPVAANVTGAAGENGAAILIMPLSPMWTPPTPTPTRSTRPARWVR